MLITIKTLSQETFRVDVETSDTVKVIKEKIKAEKSYEPENQKLIFAGKILADDSTIESYNITESGFIVVMHTPPKKESAPAPAPAAQPAETTPPVATPTPANPPTTGGDGSRPEAAAAPAAVPTGFGSVTSEAISGIVNMGFPEDLARRALTLAFNNSDRAVELLVDNDPRLHTAAVTVPQPGEERAEDPSNLGEESMGEMEEGGAGSLDFLLNTPQFQDIRNLIQGNPNLLQPLLAELQNSNPELFEAINENREEFIRLLNDPTPGDAQAASGGGPGAPVGSPAAAAGMPNLPPGAQLIPVNLSPEEQDKITTIMSVGNVSRQIAIQVFLMCDRDEMSAINYIFDHPDDL